MSVPAAASEVVVDGRVTVIALGPKYKIIDEHALDGRGVGGDPLHGGMNLTGEVEVRANGMHLLRRQNYRCAITGLALEEGTDIVLHHIVTRHAGGTDTWNNLCLVFKWAQAARDSNG